MKFIHTLSFRRYSSEHEITALARAYSGMFKYMKSESQKDKGKKIWVLNAFKSSGVRVEIRNLSKDSNEAKYNKLHPRIEMTIYITPARLLYPGINLGGITSAKEIELACERFEKICNEINASSKVDLMTEIRLDRVDVTTDVITPSNDYSLALIEASKHALNKCGYLLYKPKECEDYNVDLREEDSAMYYSKSQNIKAKLYNKRAGLIYGGCDEEIKKLGSHGLVRFELSLLKKRLKADYNFNIASAHDLSEVLWKITEDATELMDRYFIQVLYPGIMLPKRALKDFIISKCGGKKEKAHEMREFSDFVTKLPIKDRKYYGTRGQIARKEQQFRDYDVSPVYIGKKCKIIPSFKALLSGSADGWGVFGDFND